MATQLPEPSFIDLDPAQVVTDMVNLYQTLTGKTLLAAQPEMLFINLIAYRESLLREQIQKTGLANLVAFAPDTMLDYLGQLVDCPRLQAIAATTTILFTLTAPQGVDTLIDAGTEVVSQDGLVTFVTDTALTIPAGQLTGSVAATAETAGSIGNNYIAGNVNNLSQALPNVASAVNTTAASGGADVEGPDHYRERIMTAPQSFSVAGPSGAYRYFAMSANPTICDCVPVNAGNGYIDLIVLTTTGLPSSVVLTQVEAACSAVTCRPMNDIVQAFAPAEVPYDLVVDIWLTPACSDSASTVIANITALLTAFTANLSASLGNSVVVDQIKQIAMGYAGVYSAPVLEPAADVAVAANAWSACTGISVSVLGTKTSTPNPSPPTPLVVIDYALGNAGDGMLGNTGDKAEGND